VERDSAAVLEVRLSAPAARVWEALVDAEALLVWYWPASLHPEVHSEPVAGGRFGIEAEGMGFSGEYVEFDPPHRFVQAWRWLGDDWDSRVTVELTPVADGTDVRVVHDLVDAATAAQYRAGWESCLGRLPGFLEGGAA